MGPISELNAECQERISNSYQGLASEGPGSLWPKSTLGALVDSKRNLAFEIRHREKQVEVGKCMVNISIIYRVLYTRYMIYPKGSMGLVYLSTWMVDFYG